MLNDSALRGHACWLVMLFATIILNQVAYWEWF